MLMVAVLAVLTMGHRAMAQAQWTPGAEFVSTAPSSKPTTGTVSLTLGELPLQYAVDGLNATLDISVFQPRTAIDVANIELRNASAANHQYSNDLFTITVAAVDEATVIIDFTPSTQAQGTTLAKVELASNDRSSTGTVTTVSGGLSMNLGDQSVRVVSSATNLLRNTQMDSLRMVVPLAPGRTVRYLLTTASYSSAEIDALTIPNGSVYFRREEQSVMEARIR